jgi:FAD/FMN-containing dehydrogenase
LLTTPDGSAVIALVCCYAGEPGRGEPIVAPLRAFGSPMADTIEPMNYLDVQGMLGPAFPAGRRNYWKSMLLREIGDETIEAMTNFAACVPSPHTAIVLADTHGAFARVAPDATAYAHRDLPFDLVILSSWSDPAENERNVAWTRDLHQAVRPYEPGGVYVNDLDADDGQDRTREAYGANYARLTEVKRRWDPENVFRMNHNIVTAT